MHNEHLILTTLPYLKGGNHKCTDLYSFKKVFDHKKSF